MNLFIDTNIFLAFYHFTKEDLEELKKLSVLLEKEEITLFLPEQVELEFRRNREKKIADALKHLGNQELSQKFPQFCIDYPEYEKLRNLQRNYSTLHSELLDKAKKDINSKRLKADKTIENLFKNATKIKTSQEIMESARLRMELGNPPGKKGSLGDAINWEALLEDVPRRSPLYLITDDKDYISPLPTNTLNEFLIDEWRKKKRSDISFYKSLSEFFADHFPYISLASEIGKDLLIRELATSGSFSTTHSVVAKLKKFENFTAAQAKAIIDACISNNQISWIINDEDIEEFLESEIIGREDIDERKLEEITSLLNFEQPVAREDNTF